jgi:hypothetical protein
VPFFLIFLVPNPTTLFFLAQEHGAAVHASHRVTSPTHPGFTFAAVLISDEELSQLDSMLGENCHHRSYLTSLFPIKSPPLPQAKA